MANISLRFSYLYFDTMSCNDLSMLFRLLSHEISINLINFMLPYAANLKDFFSRLKQSINTSSHAAAKKGRRKGELVLNQNI